jgi:imidazole glycerol-phosphate synthase subunit HisF
MLRSRIVPCLLVHDKGLVKTMKFKDAKYVGDPINAVRIFNEKEVDELMVLDIDASVENRDPDFNLIKNLALESRMPLCYGGGVRTVEQVMQIISLGAEKVAISSTAIANPSIIKDMVKAVGSQSVIIVLDVKKKLLGGYEVYTHNGKKGTGKDPVSLAKLFEELGVGEIVINSIDNDGMMKGLDYNLCDRIRNAVNIPLTFLGGIGTSDHIGEAIKKYKTIGISAGSLFVFKGVYKAVLINYPTMQERRILYNL